MSDDIVTRLRQAYKNADEVAAVFLTNEAADYIDNLVEQLRMQADVINGDNYHTISGGLHLDAADEIERLRTTNTELVKMFKQLGVVAEIWQKTEDELIELHHGKCAEQFAKQHDEIERLQALVDAWRAVAQCRLCLPHRLHWCLRHKDTAPEPHQDLPRPS